MPGPDKKCTRACTFRKHHHVTTRPHITDGTAELLDGWVPALALAGWRLHRQPQYTDAMLALGTLAWAHKAPMPAAAAGTSLWAYSVKLGTQLLAMPAMTERARRFRLFVEEVGGSLPPGVDAPTAMRHALQALWRLPMPNSLKQPFWYCFLDAIPTAARLHTRRPCGCGVSGAFPDRRHHFADCPVAQAVATTVTQNHPPRVGANVLADLRTLTPPPGIHAGGASSRSPNTMSFSRSGRPKRMLKFKQCTMSLLKHRANCTSMG